MIAAPPHSTLPPAIHRFTTDHGSPLASFTTAARVAPAAAGGTVQGAGTGTGGVYRGRGEPTTTAIGSRPTHAAGLTGPAWTQPDADAHVVSAAYEVASRLHKGPDNNNRPTGEQSP